MIVSQHLTYLPLFLCSHYVVEKMDTQKGKWEPVAEVSRGTTCKVPKLVEGHPYLFRVSAVSKQGQSEPLEATGPTVAKNPYDEPDAPGKPVVDDYDKNYIALKWAPPAFDGGAPITGYIVERKEPRSQRWVRVNVKPVPEPEYKDDTVTTGREYQYRVLAINKAGNSEPSKPCELTMAKASRGAS